MSEIRWQELDGGWGWCVTYGLGINMAPTMEAAQLAALEAALEHVEPATRGVGWLVIHTKRAAKDAAAALRAASAGEIAWEVSKLDAGTLHTASWAGQHLKVSVWADGYIRWEAIPGIEGQRSKGDAPSVEIGKVRAVAAAMLERNGGEQ
jgi:hypothetical protein